MDHSSASVEAIIGSGDYTHIPEIPLFDRHDEFDPDGNLLRSFSEKRLQAICDHNNKRIEETGNLATFGPGHTITDAPETMQPTSWAYAHNWTVKPFGKNGVPTIHADAYVKPVVEDHAGKKLNGPDAFRSMDHRSVELWTIDPNGKRIPGYIDHIALLRQTPKRDLGFLAFQKGKAVSLPANSKLYGGPARTRSLAAAERGGKLFYSMECPMDPTLPADALAPDQAFIDKLKQALIALSPKFAAMLEPAPVAPPPMDAPGGDLPAPGGLDAPGGDPPMPEPDKFSKTATNPRSAENRLAYLEKQNKQLADSLIALRKEKDDEKLSFSMADAETHVDLLEREGFVLDREEEVSHFAKLPIGEARTKRDDYIRRTHRTGHGSDLPPSGFIDAEPLPIAGAMGKSDLDGALKYMRAHGCSFDDAMLKFKKA